MKEREQAEEEMGGSKKDREEKEIWTEGERDRKK